MIEKKNIKKITLLSIMIFAFNLPSFFIKADSSFTSNDSYDFSWSGGGAYPKIIAHNTELYLVSDVSGIWKSSSDQNEWQKINNGLSNLQIANIVFSVTAPSIGYVTTATGISKTINNGITWEDLSGLPDDLSFDRWTSFSSIRIDESNPENIYFGDDNGNVYFYENSNSVLIASTPESEIISTLFVTKNKSLLVGTSSGQYIYSKNNDNWELLQQSPIPSLDITSIELDDVEYIFSTGSNDVLLSTDNGDHWTTLNIELDNDISTHRVSVSLNENNKINIIVAWYKDWDSGVLISKDSGETWNNSIENFDFSVENPTRSWNNTGFSKIMSVNSDPQNMNTFYISSYWGVWKSTDSGLNWTENFKMGASNTVGSSITFDINGDIVTSSMDIGVIRYPVNSKPISLLPIATDQSYDTDVSGHFWNVVTDSNRMIATSSPWDSNANQIVLSEDNGQTWEIITSGLPSYYSTAWPIWDKGYARALIKDKNIDDKFYVGIEGHGLYISENGGYDWVKSATSPGSTRIYNALDQDQITNTLYWGTASNGVYSTTDNGETWLHDGLKSRYVYDLIVTPSGVVYAGTSSSDSYEHGAAIFKKSSVNAEWVLVKDFEITSGAIDALAIDPKNENRIVVSYIGWNGRNTGAIYMSNDAGGEWSLLDDNVGTGAADMIISPYSNTLYVTGYSEGVREIDLPALIEYKDLGVNINNYTIMQDWWAWNYYEDDKARSVWKDNASIGWKVSSTNESNIIIDLEVINKPGSRVLPINYEAFQVQVLMDGVVITEQSIEASDTDWIPTQFILPLVGQGEHTIELLWLNNKSSLTTDTNFAFKNISLTEQTIN